MTKLECKKIVLAMMALYQRFYPAPNEILSMLSDAWYTIIGEYSYEEANQGLIQYARSESTGFPPSPGQVVNCIERTRDTASLCAIDEGQAWALALRAISDSTYHAAERFAELPPIIQRAIGSPEALQAMGMEQGALLSVIKGQFLKSYAAALEQTRAEKHMPEHVRNLALEVSNKLLGGRNTSGPPSAWIEGPTGEQRELIHTGGEWMDVRMPRLQQQPGGEKNDE